MSEIVRLPTPPFIVHVHDLWEFQSPGWDQAVFDTLKEAIAFAREHNDEGVRKGGIDGWLMGGTVAHVFGSNNTVALNGISDTKERYGFEGFSFTFTPKEEKTP